MTQAINATGYIVTDNEAIHGVGDTAAAAWADMQREMAEANIRLLADDEDSTDELGSWTRESNLKIRPASAALLAAVKERGGDIGWSMVGGIACTPDEMEG